MNGVTIPADIIITGLKPDDVIVNRDTSPQEVTLVELTVPWESSRGMENSKIRKDERYEDHEEVQQTGSTWLLHDLEHQALKDLTSGGFMKP